MGDAPVKKSQGGCVMIFRLIISPFMVLGTVSMWLALSSNIYNGFKSLEYAPFSLLGLGALVSWTWFICAFLTKKIFKDI